MSGTSSLDGENLSCEVNSIQARLSSPHPKWNTNEFQCSICYELLLNPVVGSCGHDFCKQCIEEWKFSRQLVGQVVHCPTCRAVLLPSTDQSFGVCIRLRETIEKLFPDQVAMRRRQTGLTITARKYQEDCGPTAAAPRHPNLHSASTSGTSTSTSSGTASNATSNSSDVSTATASTTTSSGSPMSSVGSRLGGAGAAGPPCPLLDLDLLSRAAEQYRELSMLVSAITTVPAPPTAVVQTFTHAAALMADNLGGRPVAGAADLARLFLSSGAALTSTAAAAALQQQQHSYSSSYGHLLAQRQDAVSAFDPAVAATVVASMSVSDAEASAAMAAQFAVASPSRGGGISGVAGSSTPRRNGFLEAALTLLTSAAATSTAAGQLSTLVSALQQQQAAAAGVEGGGAGAHDSFEDDVLRTTANTMQQLTAEAASMNHLLRLHHQQQLQGHIQAASQAQHQAHLLQLHQAQQQQQSTPYLDRYLNGTAGAPPPPMQSSLVAQQPQAFISWGSGLAAAPVPVAPILILGSPAAASLAQSNAVHAHHPLSTHFQHGAAAVPYHPLPFLSVPVAASTAAVPVAALYGWSQAGSAVQSSTDGSTGALSAWPPAAAVVSNTGQVCFPMATMTAAAAVPQVRIVGSQTYMPSSASITVNAAMLTANAVGGQPQPMQVSTVEPIMEQGMMPVTVSYGAHQILPQAQHAQHVLLWPQPQLLPPPIVGHAVAHGLAPDGLLQQAVYGGGGVMRGT